jgi:hypothetical protein
MGSEIDQNKLGIHTKAMVKTERRTTWGNQRRPGKITKIAALKQLQREHVDMPYIQGRLIDASEERMERMTRNSLASYLAGAKILAKAQKEKRIANGRYLKITNFFQQKRRPDIDPKEDRSELDPGEL